MYFDKGEIIHLENKKNYKVLNYEFLDNVCYYLLINLDNDKYGVVTCKEVNSQLYLKKVDDEDILKKLKF